MFVIKYRGKKLSIFAPNDLPTKTQNGFSIRNIISFSNKDYYTFLTATEAVDFIKIMLKACVDDGNISRWNDVHFGVDEKLKKIMKSLMVYFES